ncbi:hypothetical protein AB0892_20335 [Streptomyces sp. NPDC005409]|uniref:hypothetical protein n=1 Tax=Streptomyces sp. NPDC005409 TaxID=3155342 RepID=UPI003453FBAF
MAADETAQEAPVPAATAREHAGNVGQDARRIEKWSVVWMLLTMAIWGWFAFLMLSDYGPEVSTYQGTRALCRGPLVEPSPQDRVCRGDDLRQWPALLGILALAFVATIVAAATTVYAKTLSRLASSDGAGAPPQA